MRALVTGGGGFLGKAIAQRLVARGDEVRSFARGDYPGLRASGIETLRGDVADADAVARAVRGVDVVFHVAALPGVVGRYADFHAANVVGTENVLGACRREGVSRLVYTSSPSVVFGGAPLVHADESTPYPRRYLTHYARTKAIAERAALAANGPALATCALRPHLVWGPGDNHLVPRVVARARAGKLRKVGSGASEVDAVYIDNAADAHVLAADALAPGSRVAGKAYFVTQGEPIAIGDLLDRIVAAAGLPKVEKSVPPAVAYAVGLVSELVVAAMGSRREPLMTRFVAKQLSTPHTFDIGAARRDFGYAPAVSVDEGMRRLSAWLHEGAGATARA